MSIESFAYPIVRMSAVVISIIATYAVHSTLLFAATWFASRRLRSHQMREVLWKVALLTAVVTSVLHSSGAVIGLGGLHDVSRSVEARVLGTAPHSSAKPSQAFPISDTRHIKFGARLPEAWGILRIVPLILATVWLLYALTVAARVISATARARRALGPRADVREPAVLSRFSAIRQRLGLKRSVRLTHCAAVSSPVALGAAEICIPDRILSELGPDELDCVLAHEAAHLIRHDPWWLLTAVTLESVFFFQPLNRVARKEIQEEAEYLADDLAVSGGSSGVTLARCLAQVAEWVTPGTESLLAPALAEHRSSLVRRVHRLLETEAIQMKPQSWWRMSAAALVFPALVLIIAPGFSPGGARAWGTSAFHWEGTVEPGKSIEIKGTMGSIQAQSWNGKTVVVTATRHGRASTPDVHFEVATSPAGVTICAVYPTQPDSLPNTCASGRAGREINTKENDTEIEFLVKVPAGIGFIARTVTGEVTSDLLQAPITAYSVTGNIDMATTAYAHAQSVSGNVLVKMGATSWTDTLRVFSTSGNVDVVLPGYASTEVIAESRAGGVKSDFPLAGVHRTFFERLRIRNSLGEHAAGVIGSGGRFLILNSLSGDISIKRQ